MRMLYVAHPIRDPRGIYYHNQNIRKAEAVAIEIWKLGAVCICPGLNTYLFDGVAPDDVWLRGDLEILERCDGIVMVPGWEKSTGATHERNHATLHGIPVFYWPQDVEAVRRFAVDSAISSSCQVPTGAVPALRS